MNEQGIHTLFMVDMSELQNMVREALAGFRESLVDRGTDGDLTEPAQAYVALQKMVGLHGKPSPEGLTMHMNKPVGDIVAVTLDKDGGLYDLVAVDRDGKKRRLGAEHFLDPDGVAELKALCSELSESAGS